MKYFRLIDDTVDVQSFLDEIGRLEAPWKLNEGRQNKIAVQREAETIPLRGLVKSAIHGRKRRHVHPSRYTTASRLFPVARAFLEAFAAEQFAQVGRAKIVRLQPGHQVHPHRDRGEYYRLRDRYHLVLKSAGSYLKSGDEEVWMQAGELWWFDNKQVHEARNDRGEERIHMIFDLLPSANEAEVAIQESDAANVAAAH